MITASPSPLVEGLDIEEKVELFTKYIGTVDNIAGTLFQDIQKINDIGNITELISIKSGQADTGSH